MSLVVRHITKDPRAMTAEGLSDLLALRFLSKKGLAPRIGRSVLRGRKCPGPSTRLVPGNIFRCLYFRRVMRLVSRNGPASILQKYTPEGTTFPRSFVPSQTSS